MIVVLSAVSLLVGQTKPLNGPSLEGRLSRATDRVLREGVHAKLPPHLSTLLGLSQETECPLMQGVLRNGKVVRGFDVPLNVKGNIVLFVADEISNDQTLYLTSEDGRLRKVVSVQRGVGRVSKITSQHKAAFEKEKEFWLSHLAPTK